jgi:glycosyltransferase involved in cell wall biosynthesis
MRVIVAGTFDRAFERNQRLLAMLERAGHDLIVCQVELWGNERYAIVQQRKGAMLVRAATAYPKLAWRLLRVPRGDVVLVLYPGWFDMLVVGVLARMRRLPVVFDPFISLSDTVVADRKLAGRRSLVGRAVRTVDRLSLRLATRVLADTPEHAALYSSVGRLSRDRIGIVRIGADESLFHPQPDVTPSPRLVLFYGTYIALHGLPTIITAAKRLERDGIEVKLIGHGQEQSAVDRLMKELRPTNVTLVDWVAIEDLPREIAAATICLGIFGTTEKAGRVLPNKLFQCLAVGRPVITADTPAVRTEFDPGELALTPPGDADALAAEIRRLVANPNQREAIAAAGHARYCEAFATSLIACSLEAELQRAAGVAIAHLQVEPDAGAPSGLRSRP